MCYLLLRHGLIKAYSAGQHIVTEDATAYVYHLEHLTFTFTLPSLCCERRIFSRCPQPGHTIRWGRFGRILIVTCDFDLLGSKRGATSYSS
jgi:hypothetical protein